MKPYQTIVIGGGPAGLAAAIAAKQEGTEVLVIEREERLGGILKQCIHDGFGLIRFNEKLTGPEYVERVLEEYHALQIPSLTQTFVTAIEKEKEGFMLTAVNETGLIELHAKTLVLATGCRERTAKQVFIHGTRPSGIFTAGTAQNFVNMMGLMPTKKCVILGSGDIGLIMARRLTLEGARVIGVYEAKSSPSGLTRNLVQCLQDYQIPLHLSKTVTRVFGHDRVEAVEITDVDAVMRPIEGTSTIVPCDALIVSVGLIPENEMAEALSVTLDNKTKGPMCDTQFMSDIEGVFSCGNALHVNDLVDFVSESGTLAGIAAARYTHKKHSYVNFDIDDSLLYLVPQKMDVNDKAKKVILYFRSKERMGNTIFKVQINGKEVYQKRYRHLLPPEMERLEIDFTTYGIRPNDQVSFCVEAVKEEHVK